MNLRHRLLAQVTALVVVHREGVDADLLGNRAVVHVAAPARHAVGDAHRLEVGLLHGHGSAARELIEELVDALPFDP